MRLGIISYDYTHLKTEQVVLQLLGRYDLSFYLLPFNARKNREVFFEHRPNQVESVAIRELALAHNIPIKYLAGGGHLDEDSEIYLLCGGGILTKEMINGKKILNAHPGIIPVSRGLDAFKWSLYYNEPLGVSLHYIDESIDGGELIATLKTNVYKSDSLQTLARRHYENEIRILSDFAFYLENTVFDCPKAICKEPRRRMPFWMEVQMARKFEEYKEKWAI